MKITKYLSVLVLILISLLLTAFSYAYWADGVDTESLTTLNPIAGETISVGKAKRVNAKINVTEIINDKKLVPEGMVDFSDGGKENNTEELILEIPVSWKEVGSSLAKGTEGILKVTNAQISDASGYSGLNVTISELPNSGKIFLDGNAVYVEVKITMDEPENKAEYQAIKNQVLTLTLDFSVSEN